MIWVTLDSADDDPVRLVDAPGDRLWSGSVGLRTARAVVPRRPRGAPVGVAVDELMNGLVACAPVG